VNVVFKPTSAGNKTASLRVETDGGSSVETVALSGTGVGTTTPPGTATVSISGGTPVSSIPQGNSGHNVLGQAGIGFAGGQLWVDGSLDNLGNVTLTLYDVGSESHWRNFLHLANTSGKKIRDRDNFNRGSEGNFTNGPPPGELVGSVTQTAGLTDLYFSRKVFDEPELTTVINGQSPMMNVPGYDYASIAYAYLNDSYQIVSGPTNRILVLLEDGGDDRDYDDYVGIIEAASSSTASPEYTVSPTLLQFGNVAVNTASTSLAVTVSNTGTVPVPVKSIKLKGKNPGQFAQSNNCPASLPVGGSCTVNVVFLPTNAGSKAAGLWVDAGTDTVKVQLKGKGSG
jgi:hypothetical protein